ncbi:MAG: NfeD family protein [Chloroflexota bacterium]
MTMPTPHRPARVTAWLKVLVLLLDDVAALALLIVILHLSGIRFPLLAVVALSMLLGTVIFLVHKLVIPSFHRRAVCGTEGMLGATGRVIEHLAPMGTVLVKGEYWRAETVEENIQAGEEAEVIGVDALTLKVKRKRS